jgi:single-strand DNA-binding protein
MNTICISGRLTKPPEIRYTGSGDNTTAVANFTVAVNRRFKREGKPDADFFLCSAFGKNATFVEKYIAQGNKVVIRGAMEQDKYANKDGQMVYPWKLMVDEIDFGEGKKSGEAAADQKPKSSGKKAKEEPAQEGYMEVPDDFDAPFM